VLQRTLTFDNAAVTTTDCERPAGVQRNFTG
jgi:hypothetical protein